MDFIVQVFGSVSSVLWFLCSFVLRTGAVVPIGLVQCLGSFYGFCEASLVHAVSISMSLSLRFSVSSVSISIYYLFPISIFIGLSLLFCLFLSPLACLSRVSLTTPCRFRPSDALAVLRVVDTNLFAATSHIL